MPYTIRKVPRKSCYVVRNKKTKRITSKCTTKTRAKKQIRLLNTIEHGFDVSRRPRLLGKTRRYRQRP